MRRLIDESELIEIIQGNEELLEFQKDECINCIKACDTAYEPDKVVEQLEKAKEKDTEIALDEAQKERCFLYAQGINRAIEIVKAGGTDAEH